MNGRYNKMSLVLLVSSDQWAMLFPAANVHAQTQTGDTALTYACENGHTDVAEVLLENGAELVSTEPYCGK